MRVLRDPQRHMIVVYEIEPSETYAGPKALVFESRNTSWRLDKYPADWRKLGNDDLLALRPSAPTQTKGTVELS